MTTFWKIIVFMLLLYSCGTTLPAQVSLEDKPYDEMLQKLLDHSVPEIKVEQINPNHVLLDSREEEEFNISRIENSYWVGFKDFELQNLPKLNKSDTIVVYCSVGYRSEKIAEDLIDAGYEHVYNLYGGLFEWCNQGKKMVNEKGKTYAIHGYDSDWSQWLKKGEIKY